MATKPQPLPGGWSCIHEIAGHDCVGEYTVRGLMTPEKTAYPDAAYVVDINTNHGPERRYCNEREARDLIQGQS